MNQFKVISLGKEKIANESPLFIERERLAFEKAGYSFKFIGIGLKGKGVLGYFKSYFHLRKLIKQEKPDIIHAHYSFSGVVSILASTKKNVVVTFLGSDVFFKKISLQLAKLIVLKNAAQIITVSDRIKAKLNIQENITTIPQGIDLDLFKPLDRNSSLAKVGWNKNKINILFPSAKNRFEKNFDLAQRAIKVIESSFDIELHYLENIAPDKIPLYLNASDIVLLTSKWEGSSNITKEAMACNTIVVSTDVGDTSDLFRGLDGYFISNHTVDDIVFKVKKAIAFQKSDNSIKGRNRIKELGLDDISTADKIVQIYQKLVNYKNHVD